MYVDQLSSNGDKYFVIMVADFSKYIWLYPLKLKSDVLSVFFEFHTLV